MPEFRLSIRIAGNTTIPTLQAISAKGYQLSVWYIRSEDGGLDAQYDAEKEGRTFSATSPQELLGLIAMWEVRGDDWRLKEGEYELWRKILDNSPIIDADGKVIDP